MKTSALIPARGGSLRIPRKNIRPFFGKPILLHSVELAKSTGLFDSITVSTDDAEIAAIANKAGCDIHWREPDDGTKGTQEVAADALKTMHNVGLACVIYPCAPLLTWKDLFAGWRELHKEGVMYAYSVHGCTDKDIGGFYWGVARAFMSGIPLHKDGRAIGDGPAYHLLPRYTRLVPIESYRAIDINVETDWVAAEQAYARLYDLSEPLTPVLSAMRDAERLEQGLITYNEYGERD